MLKCSSCGTELELKQGYTGADWESEAGKDSGFGWELSLDCNKCGTVYPLAFSKELNDISFSKKRSCK